MKLKFIVVTAMVSLLAACEAQKPEMTPIEIQSIQTRQFVAKFDAVFASTVSVCQDLGCTVPGADKATGLISAESATDTNVAFQISTGSTLNTQTRAAFVERIKRMTNGRLNFVQKSQTSSGWGANRP